MTEQALLGFGKLRQDLAAHTVLTDDIDKRETYIIDAVIALKQRGTCHCGIDTAEYSTADMTYRDGNGIECRTLALDNTCAGAANIILNRRVIEHGGHGINSRCTINSRQRSTVLINGNIGNVCKRPRNERRIAVLTENICMNVLLVYAVELGKSCTQTSGIEDSTGTYDV